MVEACKEAALERELKFELDAGNARKIAAHPLLDGSAGETRTLVSIYYDTPDYALRKAGVAMRVRDTGQGFVQTIKAAGPQLFERPEWERRVAGFAPDFEAAAATGLPAFKDVRLRERLRPGFKSTIERTVYHLPRNGALIELALDRGEVEAGMRHAPILELELELKRGEPAELFRLARQFARTMPLRLDVKTKADRGYALLEGDRGAVQKALPVALDPAMTSGEAFATIAQNCLWQIIANEPAMCAGNPEGLHQMRIGLRRLRAAIRAFGDVTAGPAQDKIKADLKWITKQLGPPRDLDVLTADVLEPLRAANGADRDFAEAHRAFMERRAKAYEAAGRSVRSGRFRHALLDMAEWIHVGPWTADPALRTVRERPVKQHAARVLARLRKKIRDQDKPLEALSARKRHKLRIRAKSLRYTIEFFAGLFPDKESQRRREAALKALKDLQDGLGGLNDLEARKSMAAGGHGLSEAAVKLLTAEKGRAEALVKQAEAARARFAKVKSFWK
jgi:inorganic triphosphatase YgiF